MAVENKYVDGNFADGKLADPQLQGGARALIRMAVASVAAADDDDSVYRLFKVPSNIVIHQIRLSNTAINDGTDYDLGVYSTDLGAAVEADLFIDGRTMAVAARDVDGTSNVDVEDLSKPLWELLGLSEDPSKVYDIAITANTVGDAAGHITVHMLTSEL